MTRISVFDVDRTLTRRPTYSEFLLRSMFRFAPWRVVLVPLLLPVAIAYAAKGIARKRMKETMHWVALGSSLPREKAMRMAENFAQRLVSGGLYPQAFTALERDREEGRRIVLATAAPEFYISPLARLLGIGDVVATGGVWHKGRLNPGIAGENCYGPAKLAMIADWLGTQGISRDEAHIRFYSDHASDLPTFEWADEPVMVNASPKLLAAGRPRGWAELDWRAGAGLDLPAQTFTSS